MLQWQKTKPGDKEKDGYAQRIAGASGAGDGGGAGDPGGERTGKAGIVYFPEAFYGGK